MLEADDLDQLAQLVLRNEHEGIGDEGQPRRFRRLRDALDAAALSIGQKSAQPRVITGDGDLLSPTWLRSHLSAHPAR